MSNTPKPDKLSALERQRQQLQQQLAAVEAAADAEKAKGEQEAAEEQAKRESARRALMQQEAARLAAERVKLAQDAAMNPTAPPLRPATSAPAQGGSDDPPTPAEATEAPQTSPSKAAATLGALGAISASPPSEPALPLVAPTNSTPQPSTTAPASRPNPNAVTLPIAPSVPPVFAPAVAQLAAVAAAPENAAIADVPELDDEPEDDEQGFSLKGWIDQSPPVLISTVFHAVGLVILGLMTLAMQPREPQGLVMEASDTPAEEMMLEELSEVELEPQEIPELENLSVAITEPDPGMIAFADVTAAVAAVSNVGDVELQPTTIGEIGALFGKDGKGMSDIGDGLNAAATFFGAKSTGSRFVFVVDNSNSMGGGKFETVLNELVRTIDTLGPRQRFYVIFFSDTAYPLFYPDPPYGMVAATPQNKMKLKAWLYTVEMCLKTKGRAAMEKAISMSPDAIYILGDGAFTDDTGKMLTAPHERSTVIHTVGMQVSDRGRQELTAIAKANKGTFRSVDASQEARAMARANPIKRNNSRGPIWGIELPVRKK